MKNESALKNCDLQYLTVIWMAWLFKILRNSIKCIYSSCDCNSKVKIAFGKMFHFVFDVAMNSWNQTEFEWIELKSRKTLTSFHAQKIWASFSLTRSDRHQKCSKPQNSCCFFIDYDSIIDTSTTIRTSNHLFLSLPKFFFMICNGFIVIATAVIFMSTILLWSSRCVAATDWQQYNLYINIKSKSLCDANQWRTNNRIFYHWDNKPFGCWCFCSGVSSFFDMGNILFFPFSKMLIPEV